MTAVRKLKGRRNAYQKSTSEGRIRAALECPYCHSGTKLVDSAVVYKGQNFGWLWACARYPECASFVGCHGNGTDPKGSLADFDTREARKQAHAAFDPLWMSGRDYEERRRKRNEAYAWLAGKLGIELDDCHIGLMDFASCRRVVEICRGFKPRSSSGSAF